MRWLLAILFVCSSASADEFDRFKDWKAFERTEIKQENTAYITGLSYILSGAIAIGSGFAGQNIATDPLEKGTYTLFQVIGVAAIGYGAYVWIVGGEDHLLYTTLHDTNLSNDQRTQVLQSYGTHRRERERRERIVQAITHAMISGLTIYTATQQGKGPVQNGLYVIGGINALAAIHYTF